MSTHDGPLLSIAIPVYNGAGFIERCLASVGAAVGSLDSHERARIEVVVCDNHSTDATAELIRAAAGPLTLRVVEPPAFLENRTSNWNHAIRATSGEWTMMLHADDRLVPAGLRPLLRACARGASSQAVMLYGQHTTFTDSGDTGPVRPRWPLRSRLRGSALRERVLPFICPFVPFTVFRRSAYDRIGGFDQSFELVQDWEGWIRLLALGHAAYVPVVYGDWRTHDFSPNYARIMATEQVRVALDIERLVPGIATSHVRDARLAAVAKGPILLGDAWRDTLGAAFPTGIAEELAMDPVALSRELARINGAMGRAFYLERARGTVAG
ncbi:MAG: glycosyltransferase [Gemmatimonadaceae bacterium]|nr:glycosyltransferase [Gemmatimonadaceae bacterium]